MMMCEYWGKPLYEVCPSIFPEGELTTTELTLWELHFRAKPTTEK